MKTTSSCNIGLQVNKDHNGRTEPTNEDSHINPVMSSLNKCLANDSVQDVLTKQTNLVEKIDTYNLKQKRSDRKTSLDKEMNKVTTQKHRKGNATITHSKKLICEHEMIVQIGNHSDGIDNQIKSEILEQWFHEFKEDMGKNGFLVTGAWLHNDEQTPHIHLDFICYQDTKKGPGLQTSYSNNEWFKADLERRGIQVDTKGMHPKAQQHAIFKAWRNQVLEPSIAKVALRHGVEISNDRSSTKHREKAEYLNAMQEVEALNEAKHSATAELKALEKDKEMIQDEINQIKSSETNLKPNMWGMVNLDEAQRVVKEAVSSIKLELDKAMKQIRELTHALSLEQNDNMLLREKLKKAEHKNRILVEQQRNSKNEEQLQKLQKENAQLTSEQQHLSEIVTQQQQLIDLYVPEVNKEPFENHHDHDSDLYK